MYNRYQAEIRKCDSTAGWRADRLSHWQFMTRLLQLGQKVCPLFGAPFVTTVIFMIDWLHCADQGVPPDWLGQLFYFLLPKLPGTTDEARVAQLWSEIQELYKSLGI